MRGTPTSDHAEIITHVLFVPHRLPEDVVGKQFDFVEADVFEFDSDGKIRRESIYPDALTLMRQLGQM